MATARSTHSAGARAPHVDYGYAKPPACDLAPKMAPPPPSTAVPPLAPPTNRVPQCHIPALFATLLMPGSQPCPVQFVNATHTPHVCTLLAASRAHSASGTARDAPNLPRWPDPRTILLQTKTLLLTTLQRHSLTSNVEPASRSAFPAGYDTKLPLTLPLYLIAPSTRTPQQPGGDFSPSPLSA